ncbi:MAG: hypothetical protein H0W84_14255 [Bacteroidetes bacterium]|nr:hypothetical protein [Bacteroidota bacterium]
MKLKSLIQYVCFLSIIAMFSACGSSSDSDNLTSNDTASVAAQEKNEKAQKVFLSIPSPIETTTLLQTAGAKYNSKYLNPIENVSKYSSITDKALNLGIYGSDLSFTSIFSQTQESMLYLRCTNTLASSLGINGAFDESTTARIEANLENKDSLLSIISDSYWISDSYLKENGQPGVSALIVAGGWIEGLYIATQIANTTKNETIISRIGEQKLSLDNLIELLNSYKTDNEGITDLLNRLLPLKKIYDGITVEPSETTASTDKESGVTTVGNSSTIKLTLEQLKQITDKAAEIRKKIVQ